MYTYKPKCAHSLQGILLFCIMLFLAGLSDTALALEEVRFVSELRAGLTKPVDVAVSAAGNIYVLDEENAAVHIYDAGGDYQRRFGGQGKASTQFKNPKSIAIAPQGRLVVVDTGNNRIQVFNLFGEFMFQFGSLGIKNGQFREPYAVVVDQFGFIFVADKGNKRVQVFSPNGIFLYSFDVVARPVDLGIDPQRNIYVLIPEAQKIVKYTSSGKKLQEIRGIINKHDFISKSSGIAVDMRGDIYIAESAGQSIKKIDKNEEIFISFGSHGDGRGQFNYALGMAVDAADKIFVADSRNSRVQVFKISGSKKSYIPPAKSSPLVLDFVGTVPAKSSIVDLYSIPGRGLYYLSDQEIHITRKASTGKHVFGIEGHNVGEFMRPASIHVTLDGKMFVADSGNNRVQIFDADGTPNYKFGKPGRKASQFNNPQGIAVNSQGNIYVVDSNNRRVQIFNYDGIFLKSFGPKIKGSKGKDGRELELKHPADLVIDSKDQVYLIDFGNERIFLVDENGHFVRVIGGKGDGPGQFNSPVDIAVDENDRLYVADQRNHRIQIFNSKGVFLQAFGSPGEGGGYFKEVSAVAASEGKIYVSDYKRDEIQVFRYISSRADRNQRVYATKAVPLPPSKYEVNSVVKYSMAKKRAMSEAIKEFTDYVGVSQKALEHLLKVESVEILNDGRVKVTVSMPKNVSKERLKR